MQAFRASMLADFRRPDFVMEEASVSCSIDLTAVLGDWTLARPAERRRADLDHDMVWSDDLGFLVILASPSEVGQFVLSFLGLARFQVCFAEKTLCILSLEPDVTQETIEHLLADQVIPRILAHEGNLVLHAGAVRMKDGAVALLGVSGRGKSTLAASLHVAGYSLLGDDALVVSLEDNACLGRAAYRSLRLFSDSIDSIFASCPEVSSVAQYTQKQRISLASEPAREPNSAAIHALFFLAPDGGDAQISVRQMSAAETCMGLVEHSFWLDPRDLARAHQKLKIASAVANRVPAFELNYPRDYARLPALHEALMEHLERSRGAQQLGKNA